MTDGHMILVSPLAGGWAVECPMTENVLMFASGARAERAARNLGACLAGLGYDIDVAVHGRDGVLIGTAHYFPAEEPASATPAPHRAGSSLAAA